MLDLAYVLLVIFIIMTTASVQGIKVNLPKASDTPSLAKPKTKAITITNDGTIFLDTYPVTLPRARESPASVQGGRSRFSGLIKAIRPCQYKNVIDVLDVLGSWASRSSA